MYATINGKRYNYSTVGKTLAKGYVRLSRTCDLYKAAQDKLPGQGHCATYFHTAVCAVAHGKPPGTIGIGKGKWTVDHKDGNSLNNRPDNLTWCPHGENTGKGNVTRHSN
jgi:hypothetical protein